MEFQNSPLINSLLATTVCQRCQFCKMQSKEKRTLLRRKIVLSFESNPTEEVWLNRSALPNVHSVSPSYSWKSWKMWSFVLTNQFALLKKSNKCFKTNCNCFNFNIFQFSTLCNGRTCIEVMQLVISRKKTEEGEFVWRAFSCLGRM